ncbi:MAG: hypothetical protein ACSLFR_03780 [Solirubrobacteraceae bacterium]
MTDDDPQLPDVPSSSEEVSSAADPERLPEPRPAPGGVEVHRPADAPHAARFQFLFGALAAVAIVAVAAAALAIARGGDDDTTTAATWSTWKPSDDGAGEGAEQIAEHIGPRYKLTGGAQLVAVTGGPLAYTDPLSSSPIPMRVAVRGSAQQGGEIDFPKGDGVLYRLCGLGENCAIEKGKASQSRHLLLRREGLELALYSFRYLDDVDQVVVFLPPAKGRQPSQALHFERGDLEAQLDRPLRSTLAAEVPSVRTIARSPDAPQVNAITLENLFQFALRPANTEAEVFLVLDPLELQTSQAQAAPQPTRSD